jgi:hypothetical protein
MSAPAGISHAEQWQAWLKTWAYLLAPDDAADTAEQHRPLGAGDQPEHDNGSASRPRDCAAVAEDARHELTSTVD